MTALLPLRQRSARAAITAIFVGNGFLIGTWAANIPRVRDLYGLSGTGLGSLLLAFGLGAIAAMAGTSALAARLGPGRVAAVAGLLLAPLFPLIAVAGDWPLLLALAALLGAISGTMDVSMNAYASQLERRWGAAIMSSFHAGWSFGGLAGAATAGVLTGLGVGLAATLATASGLAAAAGLYGLTLPVLDPRRGRGGAAAPRAVWRWPSLLLVGACALTGLSFASEGSVGDWFGVYLHTVLHTGAAWATTAYTAFALAMLAGRLGGDAVVRRLGPALTVRLGALLALLGFAFALAVANRFAVDAGLVLVGAGLANVVPVAFSAAGRLAGTAGVAMASCTGYGGLLVAPPLLGHLADAVGLRLALLAVLAGVAAMVLLAAAVAERRAAG